MSSLRSMHTFLQAPVRAITPRAVPRASIQAYHNSRRLRLPYKDDQDRESLKPRSTEGTKSSLDDDAAAHMDTAFDPSTTRPESEKASAKKESEQGNASPLDSSGANQDESQPLGRKGGSEMQGTIKSERSKASGYGSPQKHGKVSST